MPVAKTYEHMEIQGEPFSENKRMYVNVLAPKGIKKVRWYSDAEYRRMYPETEVKQEFNAKHAFGFDDTGYITIYKGHNVEEWANEDRRNIRYNLTFGYFTPGRLELPLLKEGITPVQLKWETVAAEGNTMQSHPEVQAIVASLTNDKSASEYQGIVNEWLQKEVKIREKKSKDSRYGTKHTYTLEDSNGNTYIWETGAKDYPCDKTISLKMKVKEHKEIDNTKFTVVWYCKET